MGALKVLLRFNKFAVGLAGTIVKNDPSPTQSAFCVYKQIDQLKLGHDHEGGSPQDSLTTS